jgi:hypothetical protein
MKGVKILKHRKRKNKTKQKKSRKKNNKPKKKRTERSKITGNFFWYRQLAHDPIAFHLTT